MTSFPRSARSSLLARAAAIACVIGLASAVLAPATTANAANSPTVSIVSAVVDRASGTVDDTFTFTVTTNVAAAKVAFTVSPEPAQYVISGSGALTTSSGTSWTPGVRVNLAKTTWTVKGTLKPGTRVATFTAYDAAGLPSASKSVTVSVRGMLLVTLGDSFAAGEGVPLFDNGTTKCDRSLTAWGKLLDANTSLAVPLQMAKDGFRACSGAVAANVMDTPQTAKNFTQVQLSKDVLDQIGAYPTLMLLSMGGNDAKYDDYMNCLVLSFGKGADKTCETKIAGLTGYSTGTELFSDSIRTTLKGLYAKMLDAKPNTKLVVVGYPQLAPNQPNVNMCGILSGTKGRLYNLVVSLNGKISQAVADVAAQSKYAGRIYFVDLNGAGSPFAGHDLCSSAPYFNPLLLPSKYSYHPNYAGQRAYQTALANWIAGHVADLNR